MDENSPVFYSEHCPLWVHPIYLSNIDLILFFKFKRNFSVLKSKLDSEP